MDVKDSITEIVGEEVVGAFGNVFDILGFVVRTTNAIQSMYTEIKYNTTNKNYYYPEEILPPTRQGQLAKYGELIKCNSMIINSGGDRLLFESGDYAKGTFKLSHTDKPDGSKEYSSLFIDIAAKVVDNRAGHNSEVRCIIANTNITKINEPEPKNINLFESNSCYVLPGLGQKFKFNPQYTSDYIFSLNLNTSAKIKVNGVERSGTSPVRLIDDTNNTIEIFGNTNLAIGSITIAPNSMQKTGNSYSPLENIELNTNGNYLFKIPDLEGVKALKTGNSNIVIQSVYKNTNWNPYTAFGSISPASGLTHLFLEGDYYIVLKNTSASNISTDFSVKEPDTLSLNTALPITTNANNYTYVKFTANDSSKYKITASNMNGLSIVVLNNNSNFSSAGGIYYAGHFYQIGINAGQTCYIGIKNSSGSNTITINKMSLTYQWQITGGGINEITSADTYELSRGSTYTLNLLLNGVVITSGASEIMFGYENQNTAFGMYLFNNPQNNQITLNSNCQLGGNGIIVKASVYDVDGNLQLLNTDIKIIPKIETITSMVTSMINTEDMAFTYSATKYITGIDYVISPGTKVFSAENLFNYNNAINLNTHTGTISFLSNYNQYLNYTTNTTLSIKIVKIYYIDAFQNKKSVNTSISSSYNMPCLFAGGAGTAASPYTINSARHLKNIAKSTSSNYKLLNAINLSGAWTPISTFSGVLEGSGYSVSGLSINVSSTSSGNFGLFAINYGNIENLNFGGGLYIEIANGSGSVYAGAFAGKNYGTIAYCKTLVGQASYIRCDRVNSQTAGGIGGIAGFNGGSIYYCNNYLNIITSCNAGGIAGVHDYSISECINGAQIVYVASSVNNANYDNRSIGGIVGYQTGGNVMRCKNTGTISFNNINMTANNQLQPNMGQIIGYRYSGLCAGLGNNSAGYVNTGLLTSVGSWNQKLYAGNREIGRG